MQKPRGLTWLLAYPPGQDWALGPDHPKGVGLIIQREIKNTGPSLPTVHQLVVDEEGRKPNAAA